MSGCNCYAKLIVATDISKGMLIDKKEGTRRACHKCDFQPKKKSAQFCEKCGGSICNIVNEDFTAAFKRLAKKFSRAPKELFEEWEACNGEGEICFIDIFTYSQNNSLDRDMIGIEAVFTDRNDGVTDIDMKQIQKAKDQLQEVAAILGIKTEINMYLSCVEVP